MKYILKEMTKEEKPREKMEKYGVSSLANYELLAIIIKSGIKDKSVIDLSIEIINYFTNIDNLSEATIKELTSIKGLGTAKAMEIIASIELGKRIIRGETDNYYIKSAINAYKYIQSELQNKKQEYFICIYVDIHGKVICHRVISIGNGFSSVADYKNGIKWGLKYSAYGIIFIHNHPSGNPAPSSEDDELTEVIISATNQIGIKFVDHLIVGRNSYYSYNRKRVEYVNEA